MISSANNATPASSRSLRTVSRFAWLTLGYNIAVILWGAYVRATGSGAGCGNRWPLCNDQVLPRTPQAQTIIEFTHRFTSGLSVLVVASLLIWCWRKTSKGHWARYSSVTAFILLLNEAVLGALLVLFDHVAQDRSTGRLLFLCLHFGNTLLLLGALALTAQWLANGDRQFAVIKKPRELIAIGFGLVAAISIGITGAIAALGDTIFPASSLRTSLMQDFSSGGHIFLRLRLLHPAVAAIGVIYFSWMILNGFWRRGRSSAIVYVLIGTIAAQIGLGIVNVILLAPVWLQIIHLLFAEVFWVLLVLASVALVEPSGCRLDNHALFKSGSSPACP
jgi:heme a synthase